MAHQATAAPRHTQEETFNDDGSDSQMHGTDRSSSDEESDVEEASALLYIPAPTADVPELCKALATVQLAYTELCTQHHYLKKENATICALVPARRISAALKHGNPNSADLDKSIIQKVKKFAMLYQFYLPKNLFPTTHSPDVDHHSQSCWVSPETKLEGMVAKLYAVILSKLHKYMETYPHFSLLFWNNHQQERSNILKSVKEATTLLFMPFKLDTVLLSSQNAGKGTNASFLSLLKHGGVGEYMCMAPVLFEDPGSMDGNGFLKNPVLVKIVRVMIYGKASLSQVKRGRPKARGERSGVRSVTEGLIAAATIMARFLLTANPELTEIGSVMGIPYHKDYDFYLELLFKRNPWANSIKDLFNSKLFSQGLNSQAASSATLTNTVVPAHSFDDELLEQMENPITISQSSPPTAKDIASVVGGEESAVTFAPVATMSDFVTTPTASATATPVAGHFNDSLYSVPDTPTVGVIPSATSLRAAAVSLSPPDPVNVSAYSQTSLSLNDNPMTSITMSTTSRVQFDLAQMSISNARNVSNGSTVTARRVSSHKIAPPEAVELKAAEGPVAVGRATRTRAAKTKAAGKG